LLQPAPSRRRAASRWRAAAALLVLALNLAACAAAPQSCDLVVLAQMPLTTEHNLMFVTAGINGQPVRLLVDTGAERTVLTEATVDRLGLPHDPHHVTRTIGIGGIGTGRDAIIPGITLGGTHFPVERVAVGQFAINPTAGAPADGLLGADILLAFDVDIDPVTQHLTLYRVRRCPEALPPWTEPATEVPGVETRRDRMLLPIVVDGVAGTAILDTGAQATTLGAAMAQRLGLSTGDLESDHMIMAHGASTNSVAVRVHMFRTLQIGPALVQHPTLAVVPGQTDMGDGLVGGDFLHGRHVWLSFATRRMFISVRHLDPRVARALP
jgi:predicted aspartyl protease